MLDIFQGFIKKKYNEKALLLGILIEGQDGYACLC